MMVHSILGLRRFLQAAFCGGLLALMPTWAWADLKITGLNEFEYVYDVTTGLSGITVATVELGAELELGKNWAATVGFLMEDNGATPLEVDVATLTGNMGPIRVEMGQLYVPFGRYETSVLSDPLTLDIGESRERGMVIAFDADEEKGGSYGALFAFNAETPLLDGTKIIYGVDFGSRGAGDDGYVFGVSYISHLGDSNGLSTPGISTDAVPGVIVYSKFAMGSINFIGEYVMTTTRFTGASPYAGTSPVAFNAELAHTSRLGGNTTTFAIAYQATSDAQLTALPKSRILAAATVELGDELSWGEMAVEFGNKMSWGIEYAMDTSYAGVSTSVVTLRLAIEY